MMTPLSTPTTLSNIQLSHPFWHENFPNELICPINAKADTLLQPTDVIPLMSLACFRLTGPDAKNYLQGQLTCQMTLDLPKDFTQSSPAAVLLGAHCSAKGKIQASYLLIPFLDDTNTLGYWLLTDHLNHQHAFQWLKKYSLFSKVTLTDCTHTHGAFLLPTTTPIPQPLLSDPAKVAIGTLGLTTGAYQLMVGNKEAATALIQPTNSNNQLQLIDPAAWIHITTVNQWIMIDHQMVDRFFPHYLNYPELNAVSFNKGCYLGQEVIARMQFRTQKKKTLVLINIEGPRVDIPLLTPIQLANNDVGELVQFSLIPNNQGYFLGLAVMDINQLESHDTYQLGENHLVRLCH